MTLALQAHLAAGFALLLPTLHQLPLWSLQHQHSVRPPLQQRLDSNASTPSSASNAKRRIYSASSASSRGDSYFLPLPARLRFDPAAASRRRLPILKRTALVARIFRLSPVRRLRPRRALRS